MLGDAAVLLRGGGGGEVSGGGLAAVPVGGRGGRRLCFAGRVGLLAGGVDSGDLEAVGGARGQAGHGGRGGLGVRLLDLRAVAVDAVAGDGDVVGRRAPAQGGLVRAGGGRLQVRGDDRLRLVLAGRGEGGEHDVLAEAGGAAVGADGADLERVAGGGGQPLDVRHRVLDGLDLLAVLEDLVAHDLGPAGGRLPHQVDGGVVLDEGAAVGGDGRVRAGVASAARRALHPASGDLGYALAGGVDPDLDGPVALGGHVGPVGDRLDGDVLADLAEFVRPGVVEGDLPLRHVELGGPVPHGPVPLVGQGDLAGGPPHGGLVGDAAGGAESVLFLSGVGGHGDDDGADSDDHGRAGQGNSLSGHQKPLGRADPPVQRRHRKCLGQHP